MRLMSRMPMQRAKKYFKNFRPLCYIVSVILTFTMGRGSNYETIEVFGH